MLRCLICTERHRLHKAAPPFVGPDNAGPAETQTWAEWGYLWSIPPSRVTSSSAPDVKCCRWSLRLTSPLICRVIDGPGGNVTEFLHSCLRCLLHPPSRRRLAALPFVVAFQDASKPSQSSLCSCCLASKHQHHNQGGLNWEDSWSNIGDILLSINVCRLQEKMEDFEGMPLRLKQITW